jgi:hypothetical protein
MGIVRVADDEPSPSTWDWSLDNLADRVQENLEHIDLEFRKMILAPKEQMLFTVEIPDREERIPYDHAGDCEWPDAGCSCHE